MLHLQQMPLAGAQRDPPILQVVYKLLMAPEEDARGRERRIVTSHSVAADPRFIHWSDGEWRFY